MDIPDKNFGHCQIEWEIKNVYLTSCEDCWNVYSPEFYVRGEILTKWQMILSTQTSVVDPYISFVLKRLDCNNDNADICVNAFFSIQVGELIIDTFPVYTRPMGIDFIISMKLIKLSDLIRRMAVFHRDIIYLKCELMVYLAKEESFKDCDKVDEIEKLSDDLRRVYEKAIEPDVLIKLKNGKYIQAHKCVLYSRNEYFAEAIDKNPNATEFTINVTEDYYALHKVIGFIYTGKIEYVTEKPSISIFKIAKALGVKEILDYYTPEHLNLCSTFEANEVCFEWTLQNFFRTENYVETPLFMIEKSGVTWKLRLYPKDLRSKDYVSLYAEIYSRKNCKSISMEFGVKHGDKHFCTHKKHRAINNGDIIEYVKYVERSTLKKYMEFDDLILVFRLRVSTGAVNYSIMDTQNSCVYSNQRHFENLSIGIKRIYTESLMNDVIFRSNTNRFMVNKFILAVRFPYAYRALTKENCIYLNIEYDVLDQILCFLYSGAFKDETLSPRMRCRLKEAKKGFEISSLNIPTSVERAIQILLDDPAVIIEEEL